MNFVYLLALIFSTNSIDRLKDVVKFNHITNIYQAWVKAGTSFQLLCCLVFIVVLISILYIKTLKHIEKKFKLEYEKHVSNAAEAAVNKAMEDTGKEVASKFIDRLLADDEFIKKIFEDNKIMELFIKEIEKNMQSMHAKYNDNKKEIVDSIVCKLNKNTIMGGLFQRGLFDEDEVKHLKNVLLHFARQRRAVSPPAVTFDSRTTSPQLNVIYKPDDQNKQSFSSPPNISGFSI